MPKFIKLTRANGEITLVNVDNILFVTPFNSGITIAFNITGNTSSYPFVEDFRDSLETFRSLTS